MCGVFFLKKNKLAGKQIIIDKFYFYKDLYPRATLAFYMCNLDLTFSKTLPKLRKHMNTIPR